jgi:hypothetical protein
MTMMNFAHINQTTTLAPEWLCGYDLGDWRGSE